MTRRIRATVPPSLLFQRYHGDLDSISDTERRSLRPIGATAVDVAARTGLLLTELTAIPGVRIFRGVCSSSTRRPPISHAVSAGRNLLLIESVAWPPGCYQTGSDGRITCGDLYIGQSISALVAGVHYWRRVLPRSHRVAALIVVHHTVEGDIMLAGLSSPDLMWALADDAIRAAHQRIPRGRQPVSRKAVAALIAATGH